MLKKMHWKTLAAALAFFIATACAEHPTTAQVMESLTASDWRNPDPANLVYMQTRSGEVIFELAPDFAPRHVDNLRTLIKERFFDGLAVVRSQDNYVAQWGDPNAGKDNARSLGAARPALEAERYRPLKSTPLTRLNSRDPYADYVGLANGFPVGHDDKNAWLLHCYGMVGAGRNNDLNSGNGAELYAVTGHAPRHLDRNMTLIGRVLQGMEHLTTLPRGTGSLGFYENEEEYEPIIQMRLGSEIPITARTRLQVMRTDTRAYQRLLQARTYRTEPFFVEPSGRLGICNAIIPVRVVPGQGDSN